jgi:prepilin-type N-terminal cleavage/methylation domain-containing protein
LYNLSQQEADASASQCGFTLLEVMLTVGISAVFAAAFFALTTRGHGRVHSTALEFQAMVSEARSIAASVNDGQGDSGATIQIRRTAGESAVSIYRYRPIAAASKLPLLEDNVPAIHTPAEIRLGDATTFAIFISSSGHSAAMPDFDVATDGVLATEPDCSSDGLSITIANGGESETDRLTCEMTQLELERN